MIARIAALLCLAALLAPAGAAAQDNPFGPIPQPAPQQTQAPVSQDDPAADDGLSSTQQWLIGAAAVILLGGISLAILRDAKQAAPADKRGPLTSEGERIKGTRPPPKQRVKRGRAKAKAARHARKRNR
jgi:hypothetical protein